MKQNDARKLIANLVLCGLHANGIIDEKPDEVTASLADMMKADKIINRANKRTEDRQREKGGSCSIQMTIADRGIAAMYTAASFAGGSLREPNIVGYANGNYVLVINERHFTRDED